MVSNFYSGELGELVISRYDPNYPGVDSEHLEYAKSLEDSGVLFKHVESLFDKYLGTLAEAEEQTPLDKISEQNAKNRRRSVKSEFSR